MTKRKNYRVRFLQSVMLVAVSLLFVQCSSSNSSSNTTGNISSNTTTTETDINPTLETIFSRYSVRAYTSQKVEERKVELMLKAAMAAPTAVNKQPWAFVVVNERALLDSLKAAMPYVRMFETANLAIVVCGDMNKALPNTEQEFWIQDCSAATQNLLLAAHSLGLGAVWVGLTPRKERAATVSSVLNIPSHLVPLNIIPIGYPDGDPTPKDKWKPENVIYNVSK